MFFLHRFEMETKNKIRSTKWKNIFLYQPKFSSRSENNKHTVHCLLHRFQCSRVRIRKMHKQKRKYGMNLRRHNRQIKLIKFDSLNFVRRLPSRDRSINCCDYDLTKNGTISSSRLRVVNRYTVYKKSSSIYRVFQIRRLSIYIYAATFTKIYIIQEQISQHLYLRHPIYGLHSFLVIEFSVGMFTCNGSVIATENLMKEYIK